MKGMAADYHELERGIDSNKVLLGLVIPHDFGKDIGSGRGAPVQLLVDGSDSNTAAIAMGYAENLVQRYSAEVERRSLNQRGIKPSTAAGSPRKRASGTTARCQSKNYVIPGLIAVILDDPRPAQLTADDRARMGDGDDGANSLDPPAAPRKSSWERCSPTS